MHLGPRLLLLLLLSLSAVAVGCSAGTPADADAASTGDAVGLSVCQWPASLNDPDAGRGACSAARALLSCTSDAGVGEECISNDPNHCSGANADGGVAFTCHDVCGSHEYAVVCGSVGPGPISDPPTGCHSGVPTPGGTIFYCCPCL